MHVEVHVNIIAIRTHKATQLTTSHIVSLHI
jgi:hypothetical protein